MRDNKGRFTKGSTYEEIFGSEKALELKTKRRHDFLNNKVSLGRKQTEEEIKKRLDTRNKRIAEQGYTEAELNKGKKISQSKKGYHHTDKTKRKMAESRIGKKMNLTPEGRERKRQAMLGNRYQQNRTAPCSEETKRKIGLANAVKTKASWQKDSFVAKQMKARGCSPNKPEQQLTALIEAERLPFKYVGDGEFILGGKCPDFLNTNGKKQLIELFGSYWHDVLDIGYRTEFFRQYGFSTLIIWEDELKDEKKVIKKMKRFLAAEITI